MTGGDLRRLAIRKAQKSICTYKVSAVGLNRRGEVIGKTFNSPWLDKRRGSSHAEMALMKRYYKKGLKTILLVRVNNDGDLLPIDPCDVCARKAQDLGIKIKTIRSSHD